MKRLGPILMIAFGSVLTFGGLTSDGVRAGTVLSPCETVPTNTAAEINPNAASVQVTVADTVPCSPCDTLPPQAAVIDPCRDPDPCDIGAGTAKAALVQISIPCPDPCDTIPDEPIGVGADVSVPDTVDPCAPPPETTLAPTPTTLGVSTTLNGSGAQLPGTGSSKNGIKLVIGLSLVTLGSVLLLVRRRSRPAPLAS